MKVSLAHEANEAGRSRSTILRTIRSGKLSAERDELAGAWVIDMSELARVFPLVVNGHDQTGANDQLRTGERDTLWSPAPPAAEARIAEMLEAQRRVDDVISEPRHRLEAEAEAAEWRRLTAVLADQRPNGAAPPHSPRSPWRRFLAWRT
jgi:hypothetical protein